MGEKLYHHGDLKQEMIQKGLQLLNKEGQEGFSLRKLAAMCNVSHAAPYRHFRSKDELIMAINLEIAAGFRDAFQESIRKYEGDPKRQLIELCKQYIFFMVKNPDYFRYIFMTVHERQIVFSSKDVEFEEEDHPFYIGRQYAKAYFSEIHGNNTEWVGEFLTLWSQIHGLTLLMVNRTIDYKGDYLAFAHKMIESYLNSLENLKK